MHRWCTKCKKTSPRVTCPECGKATELILEKDDTLRIDGKRELKITKRLSEFDDAGMSAVYLAERTDDPNKYGAIKVAKPTKIEALAREAETLQKLEHEHIIRLVYPQKALWQDRQRGEVLHFFALEYMAGGSLKDWLDQRKKLSLQEAVPIVQAVGEALEYAHQHEVAHLDVKPANILFDSNRRVVLSDFGIARNAAELQELKKRVGTILYNSPEQLRDPAQHTPQADIYALGLVLYEMLVGPTEFRQHRSSTGGSTSRDTKRPSSASTAASAQPVRPMPPPRQLNPSIPRAVEKVIQKAIAEDPARRYPTITSMMADFNKAIPQPAARKKLLLLLAGGLLSAMALALVAVGVFFLLSPPSTPTPPATESAEAVTPAPVVFVISSPSPEVAGTVAKPDTPTPDPAQPGPSPTVTRRPTEPPTPLPPPKATPTPRIDDKTIVLVTPADGVQVPADGNQMFQWKWGEGCSLPPDGYGFEIRIWGDVYNALPAGAMDARYPQGITCDTTTGVRSYTLGHIKELFGGLSPGYYRWDVALVKIDPYTPVTIPPYRKFYFN